MITFIKTNSVSFFIVASATATYKSNTISASFRVIKVFLMSKFYVTNNCSFVLSLLTTVGLHITRCLTRKIKRFKAYFTRTGIKRQNDITTEVLKTTD